MTDTGLIAKYNIPGPRYTSYPTVPYWNVHQWDVEEWSKLITISQQEEQFKHLALYIHLPYCDSLCTFCGCHKHITTNHAVESRYIDAVLKEWRLLSASLDNKSLIHELHLGGGTPTFFAPEELKRLIEGIKSVFPFTEAAALSFEAHPNSTTGKHLEVLHGQGFRRVSFGIQDYDPVGASTMTLMSDIKGGGNWELGNNAQAAVKMHLDKSHITTHTYPDASDPEGICTFRLDIDVATCGEIIPLRALNYMFEVFECDVVYVDYVVRGYTRLANGKKIYNDQYFNSIQDFIPKETLEKFHYRQDLNIHNDNIWQTKLMVKPTDPLNYLLDPADKSHPQIKHKMELLELEMKEVFHLT